MKAKDLSTLNFSAACYGDKLDESMVGLTGQPTTKDAFLTFSLAHEMYHRGQLTVFERLLSIEPVLTVKTKKIFAAR